MKQKLNRGYPYYLQMLRHKGPSQAPETFIMLWSVVDLHGIWPKSKDPYLELQTGLQDKNSPEIYMQLKALSPFLYWQGYCFIELSRDEWGYGLIDLRFMTLFCPKYCRRIALRVSYSSWINLIGFFSFPLFFSFCIFGCTLFLLERQTLLLFDYLLIVPGISMPYNIDRSSST